MLKDTQINKYFPLSQRIMGGGLVGIFLGHLVETFWHIGLIMDMSFLTVIFTAALFLTSILVPKIEEQVALMKAQISLQMHNKE